MRLAFGQINVKVGAIRWNLKRMGQMLDQARRDGADWLIFPELSLTGYPPEDLLLKPAFIQDNLKAASRLATLTRRLTVLAGFVDRDPSGRLFNAAIVCQNGRWVSSYRKMFLPNYGVFDEKRYFTSGNRSLLLSWGSPSTSQRDAGWLVGVSICEDIWVDETPCQWQAALGADLIINLSASPYHAGKLKEREALLVRRAKAYGSWIAYVNLVGGQDELVFDGASLLVDPKGQVVFRAPQFQEGLLIVEIPEGARKKPLAFPKISPSIPIETVRLGRPSLPSMSRKRSVAISTPPLPKDLEIFHALRLGLKDYVQKNGFSQVVLGLSGGIDSALTAAIAVAALGREAVVGVSMPSRYSSLATQRDAALVAKALGIRFLRIPIEPIFQATLTSLKAAIGNALGGVTEENLQARIRGNLLMALSNRFGWLVLATGNKSELSTGYCTLYGDMVGGFAVIKDLPKTWVYRLARTANRYFGKTVIPPSVFRRPPTAELKPNQTDQDTLPPYPVLDAILRAYVEERKPVSTIKKELHLPASVVKETAFRIDRNEYKRRQAPLGIKITPLAFGKDWRMPITNGYRED